MSKHCPEGRGSKDSGSAETQGTQLGAGTECRTAPGNGPRRWQCSLGFGGPCSVLSSVHLSLALPSEQPCEGTWSLSHVTGDETQHGEGTQPAHGLRSMRPGAGMQTPGRTGSPVRGAGRWGLSAPRSASIWEAPAAGAMGDSTVASGKGMLK